MQNENLTSTRLLTPIVIVAALGYFVDIYDLLLFGIVRTASLTDLGLTGQANRDAGEFLISMQMYGMLIGGILWGILGDKRGRLSVLFGSIITYSVANIANGMVNSVEAYAVWRLIAGIGLAGELAGVTRGGDADGVGAAILGDGDFDGVGGAIFFGIGDVFGGGVVFGIGPKVFVDLVDGLDGGGVFESGVGLRAATFGGAVAHDGDGGREGLHEERIVADVEAVMVDGVDVDRGKDVFGADEFGLGVPGEVATVKHVEVAILEDEDKAVGVVAVVFGFFGELIAIDAGLFVLLFGEGLHAG